MALTQPPSAERPRLKTPRVPSRSPARARRSPRCGASCGTPTRPGAATRARATRPSTHVSQAGSTTTHAYARAGQSSDATRISSPTSAGLRAVRSRGGSSGEGRAISAPLICEVRSLVVAVRARGTRRRACAARRARRGRARVRAGAPVRAGRRGPRAQPRARVLRPGRLRARGVQRLDRPGVGCAGRDERPGRTGRAPRGCARRRRHFDARGLSRGTTARGGRSALRAAAHARRHAPAGRRRPPRRGRSRTGRRPATLVAVDRAGVVRGAASVIVQTLEPPFLPVRRSLIGRFALDPACPPLALLAPLVALGCRFAEARGASRVELTDLSAPGTDLYDAALAIGARPWSRVVQRPSPVPCPLPPHD